MITVSPAAAASAAASSLRTPSCIQTTWMRFSSRNRIASLTIPGAASAPRKMSTMSTGAGASSRDAQALSPRIETPPEAARGFTGITR